MFWYQVLDKKFINKAPPPQVSPSLSVVSVEMSQQNLRAPRWYPFHHPTQILYEDRMLQTAVRCIRAFLSELTYLELSTSDHPRLMSMPGLNRASEIRSCIEATLSFLRENSNTAALSWGLVSISTPARRFSNSRKGESPVPLHLQY